LNKWRAGQTECVDARLLSGALRALREAFKEPLLPMQAGGVLQWGVSEGGMADTQGIVCDARDADSVNTLIYWFDWFSRNNDDNSPCITGSYRMGEAVIQVLGHGGTFDRPFGGK
jgi:hypothetical protein